MRPLALRTVLVATDLDRSGDAALDTGARLASAAGASLHVVHVVAPAQAGDVGGRGTTADEVMAAVRRVTGSDASAKVHVVPGTPADAIRSLAERMTADLVVVGPHRESDQLQRGHELGGTARAVAEHALAPCLIAAHPLRLPLQHVLVPIDLSDTARGALLVGLSWASALRAGATDASSTALTVLHVEHGDAKGRAAATVDRELETLGQSAGAWAGVDVRGVIEHGTDAARAIADYATRHTPDLVVFGTRGLGLKDLERLGSVSTSLTTRLPYPMLLVPHSVWRTHVPVP
jgi:nucleotide-binding universal stress UspA family protein